MIDLDVKIRALVEGGASRKDVLRELNDIASAARAQARQFAQGTKDHRPHAQQERAIVARIGRILFFLHHGTPAPGSTDADHQLYGLLTKCRDGQEGNSNADKGPP